MNDSSSFPQSVSATNTSSHSSSDSFPNSSPFQPSAVSVSSSTARYQELVELVHTFEKDFVKFYERGNKEAGVRLRKHMQTLRQFAQSIRDEVQEKKHSDKEG